MKAHHILLINDSCYSGDILDLSRVPTDRPLQPVKPYIIKTLSRRSRQAITSGAYEIVPDNSEVAHQVTKTLLSNKKQFFEASELYDAIKYEVSESLPLFGILKETEHEPGSPLPRKKITLPWVLVQESPFPSISGETYYNRVIILTFHSGIQ